jgi:hypothetical protein
MPDCFTIKFRNCEGGLCSTYDEISTAISSGTISDKNKKFLEEEVAYFPVVRYGPHRKRRLQQFFVAAGTSLPSRCLATVRG